MPIFRNKSGAARALFTQMIIPTSLFFFSFSKVANVYYVTQLTMASHSPALALIAPSSTFKNEPNIHGGQHSQELHPGNLNTSLNIDSSLQPSQVHQGLSHHHGHHQQHQHQQHQQQASPNYQQPGPWHILEPNNSHCLHVFEKLKNQREQSRFCDLFLRVCGRDFPAHRCVLAACSPWFDARLKVHKSTRECMTIDQCKDYEIFYAMLTYCYTGGIALDLHNVCELLNLSALFQMVKLRTYCCDYLSQNLNSKNVHTAADLAFRHSLSDLFRRSFTYLQRNFEYLYANDRDELMQYSPQLVQGTIF